MPLSDDAAVVLLKDGDTVGIALRTLAAGTAISLGAAQTVTIRAIAAGHKLALRPLAAGDAIVTYGETIGRAANAIAAGEGVGAHNVERPHGPGDLAEAG